MPIKIAIIDDKASNRNILKDKLLRHGHFEVTLTAEDGKDFLEKRVLRRETKSMLTLPVFHSLR